MRLDRQRHALIRELELPVFHEEPADPQLEPALAAPALEVGKIVAPARVELEVQANALRRDRLEVDDVVPQRVEIGIHPQPANREQRRILRPGSRDREILDTHGKGEELEVEPADLDVTTQDLRELLLEARRETLADELGSEEAAQAERHEGDGGERPEERPHDPAPDAQPDHRPLLPPVQLVA